MEPVSGRGRQAINRGAKGPVSGGYRFLRQMPRAQSCSKSDLGRGWKSFNFRAKGNRGTSWFSEWRCEALQKKDPPLPEAVSSCSDPLVRLRVLSPVVEEAHAVHPMRGLSIEVKERASLKSRIAIVRRVLNGISGLFSHAHHAAYDELAIFRFRTNLPSKIESDACKDLRCEAYLREHVPAWTRLFRSASFRTKV